MECNKDEANRAKEIAERKFNAKDTLGAKKFALKAQNLFPDLEGIPQMLATLDVYISAERKINGEADWYGVLGVDPFADDDTVRKQYRKLALMLHPDKNKSVGADGAFKLISEAWSLLSDKSRRAAYDEKRKTKAGKVSSKFGGSSAATGANGSYNFAKTAPSSARTQKNTAKEHSSSSTHKPKGNTFWTVCHRCKMQYEYLRVYLNLKLLCPNCHEAFLAVETAPPPSSGIRPAASWDFSHQKNRQGPNKSKSHAGKNMAAPNVGAGKNHSNADFQWAPFSKTSGVSNVAQAASVVQQAYDKVKREREEAQAATKREEALRRKQHGSKKGYFNSGKRKRGGMEDVNGKEPVNRMGVGNGAVGAYARDFSPAELQDILMDKARKEISDKLREIRSNTFDSLAKGCEDGFKKANEQGEKFLSNPDLCTESNIAKSEDRESGAQVLESFAGTTTSTTIAKILETMPIDVPDPDFLDFDKDRTEGSFGENQVWALYDNDDGMPRYYAKIHSVVSLNPFTLRISWLNSNTNGELPPLNWVASGFSKTCGDFRRGRHEICNNINFFSHKVRWRKGIHGAICIYPRKGDVWALYRSWSPEWNELTADEVIHKFDMVEVLEDFNEECGVVVIPLLKVAGFRAVFRHHSDPKEIRIIRREEMYQFSHQVPSYFLTGQEAPNAPKGCRVLDPAAIPSEFLQVIQTVKEEDVVDNEDCIMTEATSNNAKEENREKMITEASKPRGNDEDIPEMKILKVDNEGNNIEVTASENMKEDNCEEMITDLSKVGEERDGNYEDTEEMETLKEDK
ncbi:uncharacterized protein LOC130981759 [Arachis stenosperma]|uniref:uncharacterized protein LOC130981759 n=1 Tax=Arachis stenosperma TaxID=217475 RepID=UPI0025AD19FA|nr:uncharacterized protein LOC130981759 [Arachis stenosperma]XP_057761421.1 uncharacterized protein LOC130981759 [Arachis stenosperma]